MTPPCDSEPLIEKRIAHDYFCRFHMGVILTAVISSGILASKCLMVIHISLGIRYPLAVLASYGVFLLLVRIWIWYVTARQGRSGGGSGFNFNLGGGGGGGRSGGGFADFGGGSSGGGGASSSWEANEAAAIVAQPSPAPASVPSGGHSWSGLNLGGGGDDNGAWLVIVLLAALVACILGGGIYLVVAAPHILPEAAAQAFLAGTLTRVSKEHHHNWMDGVLRSTWIPFLVVLILAGVLGWEAHRYCPAAHRLIDVLHCPAR